MSKASRNKLRWLAMVVVLPVLVGFCMGQGCAGGISSNETPEARAYRLCSQEFVLTRDEVRTLLSACDADRQNGFSRSQELREISDACVGNCYGQNWCEVGCYNCSAALVDAVYGKYEDTWRVADEVGTRTDSVEMDDGDGSLLAESLAGMQFGDSEFSVP